LPSHASLFTGRYVYEHQAIDKPLGTAFPTLAEFLGSHGYLTAGFTANNRPARAASGFGRGFQVYDDYYANGADMAYRTAYGTLLSNELPDLGYWDIPGRKDAASVNRDFLSWLDAHSGSRFFTFLNYFDVHDPYLPPPPFDRMFTDTPTRGDRLNSHVFLSTLSDDRELSPQEIQNEIAATTARWPTWTLRSARCLRRCLSAAFWTRRWSS
jgi:arylsulfatase A-like enzyme